MKSNPEFKSRLWHSRVNAVSIGRAGSVSASPSPTLCRRALTMRGLFLIATLAAGCAMSVSATDVLAQAVPPYTDSWGKKGKNLGSGDNAGFHKPYGVAVDPAGYIYVADTANYRIQKFSPRGKLIWSFGKKGAGPGQFNLPTNVQVDGFFRIYVADYYNNRIEVFDRYQNYLFSIPGLIDGKKPCTKTRCKTWLFRLPTDMAITRILEDQGTYYVNLYVVDNLNHRVHKFKVPQEGVLLKNWEDLIVWDPPVGTKGNGPEEFLNPYGIVVDDSGPEENHQIYVTDRNNHRIQVLDSAGNFQEPIGGKGKVTWQGSAQGLFFTPAGIAKDILGNYYVADKDNHRIQKFNNQWEFDAEWGGLTTTAEKGRFRYPWGVAAAPTGCIYVAEWGTHKLAHRIQVFYCPDQCTDVEDIKSKWGKKGDSWEGLGGFSQPHGVAVDANGFVYVTDTGNHRIQKFTATGDFLSKLGGPKEAEDEEGDKSTDPGKFDGPTNVALDNFNNLYVADYSKKRVAVLVTHPNGVEPFTHVLSIKMPDTMQPSSLVVTDVVVDDGEPYVELYVVDNSSTDPRVRKFKVVQGATASDWNWEELWSTNGALGDEPEELKGPWGIVIDESGNLRVTDRLNHRIQTLSSEGAWLKEKIVDLSNIIPVVSDPGAATEDGFEIEPTGIARDWEGNYYVTDKASHNIFKFDKDWKLLAEWGGQSLSNDKAFNPDIAGNFDQIMGVAVGANGCIYAPDWDPGSGNNHRIQVFTTDGALVK